MEDSNMRQQSNTITQLSPWVVSSVRNPFVLQFIFEPLTVERQAIGLGCWFLETFCLRLQITRNQEVQLPPTQLKD